jgi:murein L,D-transpeptidase YafK
MRFQILLGSMILMVIVTPAVPAMGWNVQLSSYPNAPPLLLAIDKSAQELYLLRQHSPLRLTHKFVCSTGKMEGDKRVEGDMKTPEGVYFIESKRTGLDKVRYGKLAYTLNYPNPVDRIKGKTGYGIWIHGRGKALVPKDTEGCVALNTQELTNIDNLFSFHRTPVVVGEELQWTELDQEKITAADSLKAQVEGWGKAWEEKSEAFFTFYQPEKFTLSIGKPFQDFRSRKERLFDRYPWIEVYLDKIQIISGPDYWVTYFGQYFRTDTFSSQGTKRLYWQREKGDWKIVGSEWRASPIDLRPKYLHAAKNEVQQWLESWREVWQKADHRDYKSYYHPDAVQDDRQGIEAIMARKEKAWSNSLPEEITLADIEVNIHQRGLKVTFEQHYKGQSDYKDRGYKELIIEPFGQTWRILAETWHSSP